MKPNHPFKTWLLNNHVHEDTTVGDLARDVRLDVAFPSTGERRDLRRYLTDVWDAASDFLICFEEAWRLYEPDGSPADNPFTTWLLRLDLRDETPLGNFARDYANIFPLVGDRLWLRGVLQDHLGGSEDDDWADWTLACFDVAWKQYEQCVLEDLL